MHKDVESEGIKIIRQPANSPSVASCDFWLFDLIKENLSDDDSSQSHNQNHTFDRQKELSINGVERMQLCINNQGNYFEHLMK